MNDRPTDTTAAPRGLWYGLSAEQQKAALEYRGPDDLPQYVNAVYGPHEVTGTLKDKWNYWRMVLRQGYWRPHHQVSSDGIKWKELS